MKQISFWCYGNQGLQYRQEIRPLNLHFPLNPARNCRQIAAGNGGNQVPRPQPVLSDPVEVRDGLPGEPLLLRPASLDSLGPPAGSERGSDWRSAALSGLARCVARQSTDRQDSSDRP